MSVIIPERTAFREILDEHVQLADFSARGMDGVLAFAILDEHLGFQIIVDSHLDAGTRAAAVSAAIAELAAAAPRFALIEADSVPSGGAA